MNYKNLVPLYITILIPFALIGQSGLTDFPELTITNIPGSPKLGKPQLITGTKAEVMSEGNGLAAPAFYDWDGDGLKDLLIGEFGSGLEHGRYVGNFIRVYRNINTQDNPEFDGRFDYARPPFEYNVQAHGTPYSIDQFCCMSFAPQFTDLNSDGYADMVTGSYQGEVLWFRGSEYGFMPGEPLSQEGNPRDPDTGKFMYNQPYWLYSSASFADLNNDELLDLILGGTSLRISRNIGTKESPLFGKRELLLDIHDQPLKIYDYTLEELKAKQTLEEQTRGIVPVPISGGDHLSPYVVDWDNDGVIDLLVTNFYTHQGLDVVTFFKGVKKNDEHRFHPGIPLFTATNKSKAFPGSAPRIYVTDWNNDGVNDLLIGASVVMLNGVFSDALSWNWEKDMELHGAGKDPALMASLSEKQLEGYKKNVKLPPGITIDEYMTILHRGYVYVMLGSKEEIKPAQTKKSKAQRK